MRDLGADLDTRIELFQAGPRILHTEDEDVSAAVAAAFRQSGIVVHERFGAVESFEKTPSGVRMIFRQENAEAALAIVAVGWIANTAALDLPTAGVEINHRGFVQVDFYLRTSAPHIFAAGDVTGRLMLVSSGDTRRLHRGHQRRTGCDDDAG